MAKIHQFPLSQKSKKNAEKIYLNPDELKKAKEWETYWEDCQKQDDRQIEMAYVKLWAKQNHSLSNCRAWESLNEEQRAEIEDTLFSYLKLSEFQIRYSNSKHTSNIRTLK